jgi:hypothetical protein
MAKTPVKELTSVFGNNTSDVSSDSDQDTTLQYHPSYTETTTPDVLAPQSLIDAINRKIENGEPFDLSTLRKPLYVVHYRGVHYFRDFFPQDDRRASRNKIQEDQDPLPILSPAVYELLRKKFGTMIIDEELSESAIQQIQAALDDLYCTTPTSSFWAGKKREHLNLLFRYFQRYVNNYAEFREESRAKSHDCYRSLPFTKNPFVSTADEAKHAILYALGGKSALEHGSLRPVYQDEGRAKHPKVGYVQTILHELTDFIHQKPLMLSALHAANAIDIKDRTLNERETAFRGVIPERNIAKTNVIRYPSLNREHETSYHKPKYGLSKRSYNLFSRNIVQTPKEQTGLLDNLAEHYTQQLATQTAHAVNQRKGYLVYIGLDGRLQRTMPTKADISTARQHCKKTNTTLDPYAHLELLLPNALTDDHVPMSSVNCSPR